ncbi:MAG: dethiobiotin synthase [Magnetovibrio sp.]|nr:dethiobiotin synthase [Magnetovibrio sp.]
MTSYFVTASGTGVGKTHVTARLTRELMARGKTVKVVKPLITGFTWHGLKHTDTGILLHHLGLDPTPENVKAISPWRFDEPVSPDMAARHEGRDIDFDEVIAFSRDAMDGPEDVALIEGVGGVMVPMDDTHTVADWIAALDIPTIVVVGTYLGTLSHTLTTIEAMRGRGLAIEAVVVSESEDSPVPLEETAETIERFLPDMDVRRLERAKYDSSQPDILADIALAAG